jgi:signal transduction histidine kinase
MITSCLLFSGLVLLILSTVLLLPRLIRGDLAISTLEAILLGGIAAGLIAALILQRLRQLRLAGWVLLCLTLATLGVALYAFPLYRTLILPAAVLPVALAALLLDFQDVYIAALLAVATTMLVWWFTLGMPQTLALPAMLPAISSCVTTLLTAMIVAPVRRRQRLATRVAQHADTALAQAGERIAEGERRLAASVAQRAQDTRHIHTVLDRIGDGLIISDDAGKVTYANPAARSIWASLVGGEFEGRSVAAIAAALRPFNTASGKTAGSQHIELFAAHPNDSQPGEGTTYVLLDRRDRARLARLRGELLELLAEEMRDPLASMLTALEMTLGQNLPDGADRVLVGARRSGQQLLDLVVTLLEINQLEGSREVLRRSPASLRSVVEGGIAQTSPLAQKSSVHVVVEYGSDAMLPLDKDRLRRAFVNLLDIALRRSPPYSTIQVKTQRQGNAIVVRVSDQGPGMPLAKGSPTLGMTFSKLVVEAHDGRLWEEESRDGQGSTMCFMLPLGADKG